MMMRRALAFLVVAVALVLACDAARAQGYPDRPIKLVVPFPAGGAIDMIARLVAQRLSETVGTTIVDNRAGANGALASKAVAAAEPDGYTLLFCTTGTFAISPALD